MPSEYEFVLLESGLRFGSNHPLKLSNDSCAKLLTFQAQYEGVIQSLCHLAKVTPTLYWGDGCEPFAPFAEHYKWMVENEIYDVIKLFDSDNLETPIASERLSDLVDSYAFFYPVYDSHVRIAKGEQVRFDQLIERLTEWWKKESEKDELETKDAKPLMGRIPSEENMTKARQLADRRVRVMPAIRWQVFERDGWKCVACGRVAADEVILHIDHIVPRSKGGADTMDNYQTLCSICNLGKSNKDDTDLRKQ